MTALNKKLVNEFSTLDMESVEGRTMMVWLKSIKECYSPVGVPCKVWLNGCTKIFNIFEIMQAPSKVVLCLRLETKRLMTSIILA